MSASESARVAWTDDDYNGLFVLKALRRKSFSGRCVVNIGAAKVGVRSAEREVALRWFANAAHTYLFEQKVQTPLVLIPVPNTSATGRERCDTAEQAMQLATSIGGDASVLDIVRWSEPVESGDARYFYDRAVLRAAADARRKTTLLVDELCSDGAALLGIAAKLRIQGINVDFALFAGFIPHGEPPVKVFQPHVMKLAEFVP
ncbi:MAG: hypothetical protein H7Z43_01300 [Clostridia bacterium]|nr:hypothetical protein [Deltaproteobacteria bacterium]